MIRPLSVALLSFPLSFLIACDEPTSPSDNSPPPSSRLNLIIVCIDTLRADRLGCYGYDRPTSPSIDSFAEQGTMFEVAYATSPWTKPSHASLFTGLYPSRNGATGFLYPLSKKVPHLAETLSVDGYQTAAIVGNQQLSWHGLERGFESFQCLTRPDIQKEPTPIVDKAIEWIENRDPETPFFAFIHSNDVHSNYRALPRYTDEFVRPYQGQANGTSHQLFGHMMGMMRLTHRDTQYLSDLYDAAIRQVDEEMGRLFSFFEQEGLFENSLIVFTADHGEEFLEHDGLSHGFTQYEESVRIPMVFRGPNFEGNTRRSEPVSLIDVVPTVLNQLEIASPEVDGLDLLEPIEERPLFLESNCDKPKPGDDILNRGDHRAVRWKNQKLYLKTRTGESKLFDLRRDPKEIIDFAQARKAEVQERKELLKTFAEGSLPDDESEVLTKAQLEELRRLGYATPKEKDSEKGG